MILSALTQYAGLTRITGDIFYTSLQWGHLASPSNSHDFSWEQHMRMVSNEVRAGNEGVLQLQILVLRYSHWHSVLFRHLSVLIQETVLIMLINSFGDDFSIRFEFMKVSQHLALL